MGATFTAYPDLNTPNEVIEKMRDFVRSKGYDIVQNLADDLDIYDQSVIDGKKFSFLDKSGNYIINLRSQNGINIFGVNDEITQSAADKTFNTDKRLSGVGMTVSESYSDETRWYNQYNVPLKFASDPSTVRDVLGVYMPVPTGIEDIEPVDEPDEVQEPEVVEEPEYPDLPTPPIPPVQPQDTTSSIIKPKKPEKGIFKFIPDNITGEQYLDRYTNTPLSSFPPNSDEAQYGIPHSAYAPHRTAASGNAGAVPPVNVAESKIPNYYFIVPGDYQQYVITINGKQYVPTIGTWVGAQTGTGETGFSGLATIRKVHAGSDGRTYRVYYPVNVKMYENSIVWPTPSEVDYSGITGTSDLISPLFNASYYSNHGASGTGKVYLVRKAKSLMESQQDGTIPGTSPMPFDTTYTGSRNSIESSGKGLLMYVSLEKYLDDLEYEQRLDNWNNETGPEWDAYRAELAQAQAEYEQAMAEYSDAYEQYVSLKTAYDAEVADILASYQVLLDAYNAYLVDQANYDQYLELLAEYNAYLQRLEEAKNKFTLFCNEVLDPADENISTITFSLLKTNDTYYQVSHLIVGNLIKYDKWTGGIIFSGSANRYNMIPANYLYTHDKTSDRVVFPVLSSGKESNTFLRINIDNAPQNSRGNILWASSGQDNITGKPLSLPIRTGNGFIVNKTVGTTLSKEDGSSWTVSEGNGNTQYGNGEVPHYYFMQSHQRLDSGRNVNTLNCITINMPIFAAVLVDPDELNNYAAAGEVLGVYFVSMYNIQTSSVYEINYPASNDTCQAFSVGKRRGVYGFDGISIKQMDTPIGAGDTPTSGGSGGSSGGASSSSDTSTDPFPNITGKYQQAHPDTYKTDTGVQVPLNID